MTTYQTIHTDAGIAAMQASTVSGIPMNITHMAVGDGGGDLVTPSAGMTSLVHEVYRTAINRLEQDPGDPSVYFVELTIPYNIGGWVIREFGVIDTNGDLIAVGNFPPTYKTVPADGASSDMVIQVIMTVSNAGLVTLVMDPAVMLATRSWVTNNITRAALIPGGTTHQVLRKVSNTSGDTEWVDPVAATVLVNTIEETQTAAAAQATFTLATTTTFGLGVFKNGIRIPKIVGASGWQQGVDNVHVVLGTACAGGELLTFLQNEPAASIPNPLDASMNLSDVASVATARTNLGVYSKTEADSLSPAGNVAYTARLTPPPGWLVANGASVSRAVYSALFAAIGTTYGSVDGASFSLPDLRGEFIRGADSGRGVDPGRAVGTAQGDEFKSHAHNIRADNGGYNTGAYLGQVSGTDRGFIYNVQSGFAGGAETRPRNVALLPIIKF